MTGKVSVIVEPAERGFDVWCPELTRCQTQGRTVEEALTNIRVVIELYLKTLTTEARLAILSREVHGTTVEVRILVPESTQVVP